MGKLRELLTELISTQEDKIEKIDNHIDFPYSIETIDGTGCILTPGLIDRHVHVTGGGGEGSFHTRTPQVELSSILKAGITTVLGLLGTDDMSRSVENLLAKVKALKEEGITAYALCGAYGYPPVTLTGSVKKDIAFVAEIMGLKLALSDHRAPNISVDELIRLGSDVRTAGMIGGKPGFIVLHMGSGKKKLGPVFEALAETDIPVKTFQPTHMSRNHELYLDGLKLAAVNTPNMLSTPLSIMAALVMGDFSVSSGWFNAEIMLYMSFVAVANYSQTNYELTYAVKFMRILNLILTVCFGVYGFIAGIGIALIALINNRMVSGRGYLYPLIPFDWKKLRTRLTRRNIHQV